MGALQSLAATSVWYMDGRKRYGRAGFEAALRDVEVGGPLPVDEQGEEKEGQDVGARDGAQLPRHVVITGANQGIGRAVAEWFVQQRAGRYVVHLVCRSLERGNTVAEEMREQYGGDTAQVFVHRCDISDFDDVRALAQPGVEGGLPDEIFALVNNAGGMPRQRTETAQGVETIMACMLGGCMLLTEVLLPRLRAAAARHGPARVINVSSGGMYTAKLDVTDCNCERRRYSPEGQYAQAKRAQVILTRLWADKMCELKEQEQPDVAFASMHPGWVDTQALRESMPDFYRAHAATLRTPAQGADTILYLATAQTPALAENTGQFWFDRRQAPEHLFAWDGTHNTDDEERQLWLWARNVTGLAAKVEAAKNDDGN